MNWTTPVQNLIPRTVVSWPSARSCLHKKQARDSRESGGLRREEVWDE